MVIHFKYSYEEMKRRLEAAFADSPLRQLPTSYKLDIPMRSPYCERAMVMAAKAAARDTAAEEKERRKEERDKRKAETNLLTLAKKAEPLTPAQQPYRASQQAAQTCVFMCFKPHFLSACVLLL